MDPFPEKDRKCKNCAFQTDKGGEHCDCCGQGTLSNWVEASWHVELRADLAIATLETEISAAVKEIPGYVIVREGGADEDVAKSLAVSAVKVAKHVKELEKECQLGGNRLMAAELMNATLEAVLSAARGRFEMIALHAPAELMFRGDEQDEEKLINVRDYAEYAVELLDDAQNSVLERAEMVNELMRAARALGPWMSAALSDSVAEPFTQICTEFVEAVVALSPLKPTEEELP